MEALTYNAKEVFPSPYRVLFILILCKSNTFQLQSQMRVSVPLRSIIHSYYLGNYFKTEEEAQFPSPCGVLFILIRKNIWSKL